MFATRTMQPSSSVGYWRGSAGISGPDAGGFPMAAQGTAGLSIGTGALNVGGKDWHPSVLYLLALVIVEMVVFRWIGQILK